MVEITRITEKNADGFSDILPERYQNRKDLLSLGAVSGEREAVGGMAVGIYDRIARVEWLFTLPSWRGRGVASELLDTLVLLLADLGIECIEFTFHEDRENLEDFLEGRGFVVTVAPAVYKVPIGDLIYSETMDRLMEREGGSALPVPIGESGREKLVKLLGSLGPDGAAADDFSLPLSFLQEDEEAGMTGGLLLKELGDGDLEAAWFRNASLNDDAGQMILALRKALEDNHRDENNLIFSDEDDQVTPFVEKLLGEDIEDYRVKELRRGIRLV